MAKTTINIPLVTFRGDPFGPDRGRPRFFPGPTTRALGYKAEDLRHGKKGQWYTLEECKRWADRRQAEIALKREAIAAGQTTIRRTAVATTRARQDGLVTIAHLLTAFRDLNPRMLGVSVIEGRMKRQPLAAATVRGYAGAIRLLEKFEEGAVWAAPAEDLHGDWLAGVLDAFEKKHGLAMTRAVKAMLSAAYGWGASRSGKRLVSFNPVKDMEERLPVLPPRVRYGTEAEMDRLIAVADALGLPDIGDAVCFGLFTGQRQADRLALTDMQITADGIRFMQRKKGGQPLLIPMIDELRDRVRSALERRREWRLNYPNVLIDERQRRPWDEHRYRKIFRIVRHVAATGGLEGLLTKDAQIARELFCEVESLRGEGQLRQDDAARVVADRLAAAGLTGSMPSLNDFRDQDLRDTAVTWLALCGCDEWEVASITGHSLSSIKTVLAHYFGLHPELARRAMAKLQTRRVAR